MYGDVQCSTAGLSASGAGPDIGYSRYRLLERRQAMANGEFDERRQVSDTELLHCPRAIGFDRPGRKAQERRGRGVGLAVGDQLQDLALAGSQAGKRILTRPAHERVAQVAPAFDD